MRNASRAAAGAALLATVAAWCLAQPEERPESAGAPAPLSVAAAGERAASTKQLIEVASGAATAQSLMDTHGLLASEPHMAGTIGDLRTAQRISEIFKGLGLEVQQHEVVVYLCKQRSAALELVLPDGQVMTLPTSERPVEGDEFSTDAALAQGWNAYSGSGDVTAGVVYANYGTREDFARLRELGVDVRGTIVIARYGGNFRGYKAKFAEQAGAVGLVIYTDPADAGYCRGLMYPEGGYANDTCIQRGSLITLDYPGDPLTPGVEATAHAPRLDPDEINLPRIPVLPVGWGAVQPIMEAMKGAPVPEGWQGGMPMTYRLRGDGSGTKEIAGPRVRLAVDQERSLAKTFNVIGTLRGWEEPDSLVLVGAHHDAWGYGACDPLCGTITVLEAAKGFARAAEQGMRPRRSIVFAAWGAEEFGIIGSTEWVESRREELLRSAVAYINLDMASMGTQFGASAWPSLRPAIVEAARGVPQARDGGKTVLEEWTARAGGAGSPGIGDVGGGSDHVAFLCSVGVASAGLGSGGSQGTSYHSVYDNLAWYWKVVGVDYEPALMVTRMTNALVGSLANEPIVPLRCAPIGEDCLMKVEDHAKAMRATKVLEGVDVTPVVSAAKAYVEAAREVDRLLESGAEKLSAEQRRGVNAELLAMDRAWLSADGLPGRPWYKNTYASPDEDSGYAAWVMPLLAKGIRDEDAVACAEAVKAYVGVLDGMRARLERVRSMLSKAP
ncbi:MAG: M20/M25/M40 family metallo-hydrolase [Phycisphaerales bacterium]|nr:M20/M25/M40 family metallo-hydrolase [Phycisphaerales bacterium]